MRIRLGMVGVIGGALVASTAASAQSAPEHAAITVIAASGAPRAYTMADLAKLPADSARLSIHEKGPYLWSGTSLRTLLSSAGLDLSRGLHGPALAQYVVLEAADGYRVVFAIAEIDSTFGHRPPIVVWRQDGALLTEKDGPVRLVVPDEPRGGRWIRQLIRIEVRTAP